MSDSVSEIQAADFEARVRASAEPVVLDFFSTECPPAKHLVVVGGAGPAGLTSAIYASRARLRTLVLDDGMPDGQVKITHKVSNYPGFPEDIKGSDLVAMFAKQAERFGARIARALDSSIDPTPSAPTPLPPTRR